MFEVKEVTEELVPEARRFLTRRPEFRPSENWDPLFIYDWKLKEFPYGYALFDDGNMVGFVGTIFSERMMNGKKGMMCCLSAWVVDSCCERGSGRSMLNSLLKMDNVTFVGVILNHRSIPALQKLDFQILEREQIVVPVVLHWFKNLFGKQKDIFITLNKEVIGSRVHEKEKKILEDHKNLECLHFLIEDKQSGRYCYGIGTTSVIQKKFLPRMKCLNLCYLSDADFFTQRFNRVSQYFHSSQYDLIRYDSRLISQKLSQIEYKIPKVRLFKSTQFERWEVDNLYTELVTWNRY